jgi:SMI1 / KNR4 family (SUKH-1)
MDADALYARMNSKKAKLPTKAQVVAMEKAIGVPLPADYLNFLQRCGAGELKEPKPAYNFRDRTYAGKIAMVGGCTSNKRYSVLHYWENPDWPKPPRDCLAIMDDDGGNAIVMAIGDTCYGQIFHLDHEMAPSTHAVRPGGGLLMAPNSWNGSLEEAMSENWGYAIPLAASFGEFLNGLYDRVDDGEE